MPVHKRLRPLNTRDTYPEQRLDNDLCQVVDTWLKGVFPVSTGLVVSALARPEWVVEVDATAVIPDRPAVASNGPV